MRLAASWSGRRTISARAGISACAYPARERVSEVGFYGVPFVSKRFFSVNLRYSCHDSLSRRRFSFRGDDSLFAATILFSRRRLSFRGDDSLFAATILFSWRLIDMGCRLCQNDFSP